MTGLDADYESVSECALVGKLIITKQVASRTRNNGELIVAEVSRASIFDMCLLMLAITLT